MTTDTTVSTTTPITINTTVSTTTPMTINTTVRTTKPTTINTSVPTTTPTTINTFVSTTTLTKINTAVPTTKPMTINTYVPPTTPMTINTSVSTTTLTSINTAVPTTTPIKINTAVPTTTPIKINTSVPTTTPMRINTTMPTTTPITINTTVSTTTPITINTTVSTTTPITINTTVSTTTHVTTNTSVPTTTLTTINTAVPTTLLTTINTTVPTTKPTTINTTMPTTTPIKINSSVPTTTPMTTYTTVSTTTPMTINTTMPTTTPITINTPLPTTTAMTINTTVPTTTHITINTTVPTTTPMTINTTVSTTTPTTINTTVPTTTPTTLYTNVLTHTPTTIITTVPTTTTNATPITGVTNLTTIVPGIVTAKTGVQVYVQLEFFLSSSHFEKKAEDNNTEAFQNLNNTIHPTFYEAYKSLTGFVTIKIIQFKVRNPTPTQRRRRQIKNRSSELTVVVQIVSKPFNCSSERNINDVKIEFLVKTTKLLTNGSWQLETYLFIKINQSLQEVNTSVTSAIEQVEFECCPEGYRIDKGKCYWYKPCMSHPCQHNGKCIVNIKQKATCQCSGDDKYTYFGAYCEYKAKKMFLDFKYIIAAATGWSAAVVLIITVMCCMYRLNRVNKKNRYDNENIHEHETLSYNHPMGLLGRQRVPSNFYLTNASRDESHFIDYRRRHTYMESNMDINNLSNETTSDVEDDIDYIPDFCNNAIFETEFNIKRPQIRSESIPVFNNFGRPTAYRPDYI